MNTKTIEAAGRSLSITPVKVKNLPAFLAAIEPVVRELGTGAPDDLLGALSTHAPNVIAATALGAGVTADWLGEQTPEVLVELAAAVLEVNMDFFVQVLLPRTVAATEQLRRLSELAPTGGTTGLAA
jgi:hypothetical protein